jgi:hypothetical protein
MRTLEEAQEIVERLNDDAHEQAWDSWAAADREDDQEAAEEMREDASSEQAEYFRDGWYELDLDDQDLVQYWLDNDEDFREQFAVYFGEAEFDNEFNNKDE